MSPEPSIDSSVLTSLPLFRGSRGQRPLVAARDLEWCRAGPEDQVTGKEASTTRTAQPGAVKRSRDGARETGPALELHYRFILWLVPTLDRFPRALRFLLRLAYDLRSAPAALCTNATPPLITKREASSTPSAAA